NVPVDFEADALKYRGGSRERSFQIFTELGFRAFAHEYAPTASSIAKSYRTVNTADGVRALADRLKQAGSFSLRVLQDRPATMQAGIVGLAFATAPRDADYVPTGHHALGETASLPIETVLGALKGVLENPAIAKIGHNLKTDAI